MQLTTQSALHIWRAPAHRIAVIPASPAGTHTQGAQTRTHISDSVPFGDTLFGRFTDAMQAGEMRVIF